MLYNNCKIKQLKHPPKSKRFCDFCEKETTFKYNPGIGHSECCECGYRQIFKKLLRN